MIRTFIAAAFVVAATFALTTSTPALAGGYGSGGYGHVQLCAFQKWDPYTYSWVTYYAPCTKY